jgi:hypothetical protein
VKEEGGDDLFGDDDDRVKKEDLVCTHLNC